MHFGTKSYLKSTRNHTVKHTLIIVLPSVFVHIIKTHPLEDKDISMD
jgi:hypothetical protein